MISSRGASIGDGGGATACGGGVAAIWLSALLALILATPATAKIVSHERTKADGPQRVSRAAIAAAQPRDLLRPAPGASGSAATASPAGGGGSPGYIDGRPPAGGAAALAARAQPDAGASGFNNFTTNAVAEPAVYPNSTNGKIFGRIPGIGDYTCSASVVHARNKSVLFTAGHCVKEPGRGGWAKKLIFVPAYSDGSRPFGQWNWNVIFTKKGWAKAGNPNYDYAAVTMRKGGRTGKRIEQVVGSLGFAFNIPVKRQTYRPVGYPFNKFDTEVMWECISTYGGRDPFYRKPGPPPIGVGCDMLGGASGGGWSIAQNRLASVTSFGFDGRPNELYGPKFNKQANRMRLAAGRARVG